MNLIPERQGHIQAIAQALGLGEVTQANTIGKVLDFCLRTVRYFSLAELARLSHLARRILDTPEAWETLALDEADIQVLKHLARPRLTPH